MPAPQHPTTKQPEGADVAEKLTAAEVRDEKDTTPRAAPAEVSGKRVRAIPYQNASTVILNTVDFKTASQGKISDHPQVVWDFRKDNFTVPVGGENPVLTEEAAEFLTKNYPTDFEYINNGDDGK